MTFVEHKHEPDSPVAEYSVYIFHGQAQKENCAADWEKKVTTKNKHRAIAKAKKLHASQNYEKVEIKRKLLNPQAGCAIDKTFRVFKRQKWLPDYLKSLAICCGLIFIISASALLLSYIMQQ